jgi:predicted nucleic acid-binding protein
VTRYRADGNVLVALAVVDHVHHAVAIDWFERELPDLATCPNTEGTLLRFLIRSGDRSSEALGALHGDAVRLLER